MPGTEDSDPRAPGDRRMYLYFNYSESGSLRWYVKVSRKGRRVGISEEYGTPAFDIAYEAGVAALGGVMRMRRVKATIRKKAVQGQKYFGAATDCVACSGFASLHCL